MGMERAVDFACFSSERRIANLNGRDTLFKGRFTLNIPVIMAGLVIATVPIVLIYIFAQKYLVEGMLAGSVKELRNKGGYALKSIIRQI